MLIVVVGDPGAGRSTLANYLAKRYGFKVQRRLPAKRVPDGNRVVVDSPTLTDPEAVMASGRRLTGHVEMLGGITVRVSRRSLSGIHVVLPNAAYAVDPGRLMRTTDVLMTMFGVREQVQARTRK